MAEATKKSTETTTERKGKYYYANGKRKTAIATVRLYQNGKGDITVNEKAVDEFFFGTLIGNVMAPLKVTNMVKQFDVVAEVTGGGVSAQSDAVRHGIAKALLEYDASLRQMLKREGYLTRDSRVKERKKYGLKRARRAPQFSKR